MKDIFTDFFSMVTLDKKAYKRIAHKPFSKAAIIFLLVTIAATLGGLIIDMSLENMLFSLIGIPFVWLFMVLFQFIYTGILWIFAKMFAGKGKFMDYYTALSYSALWGVLYIIPILGAFLMIPASIWAIVMDIFVTREVHKLSTGKAVAVVLIPAAIALILIILLIVLAVVMFASFSPDMLMGMA